MCSRNTFILLLWPEVIFFPLSSCTSDLLIKRFCFAVRVVIIASGLSIADVLQPCVYGSFAGATATGG